MNYQQMIDKTIVSYYSLKKDIYPDVSIAKDGTIEIIDYHVIALTPVPPYDIYTQKVEETAPVNYAQTWDVDNLNAQEIIDLDASNRVIYADNMTTNMLTAQVDALGAPAVHRYTQAITRFAYLNKKVIDGGTLDQEEIDFIGGAEIGLEYQEDNAAKYKTATVALESLTGQAIVDYTEPDFTMTPTTQTGYKPYLDYLEQGYVD